MITCSTHLAPHSFGEALARKRHVMPIGLSGDFGGFRSLMLPIFIMAASGVSVPISGGRSPDLLVQA